MLILCVTGPVRCHQTTAVVLNNHFSRVKYWVRCNYSSDSPGTSTTHLSNTLVHGHIDTNHRDNIGTSLGGNIINNPKSNHTEPTPNYNHPINAIRYLIHNYARFSTTYFPATRTGRQCAGWWQNGMLFGRRGQQTTIFTDVAPKCDPAGERSIISFESGRGFRQFGVWVLTPTW